jgi:hypothetical protein
VKKKSWYINLPPLGDSASLASLPRTPRLPLALRLSSAPLPPVPPYSSTPRAPIPTRRRPPITMPTPSQCRRPVTTVAAPPRHLRINADVAHPLQHLSAHLRPTLPLPPPPLDLLPHHESEGEGCNRHRRKPRSNQLAVNSRLRPTYPFTRTLDGGIASPSSIILRRHPIPCRTSSTSPLLPSPPHPPRHHRR